MNREKIWLGLAVLGLVVTACSPPGWTGSASSRYTSTGERIYFTGTSVNVRDSSGYGY